MKQLNLRSITIGFVGAVALIATFSFTNQQTGTTGRFQSSSGASGVVILDTQTGDYLINNYHINQGWRKGNFAETHSNSK